MNFGERLLGGNQLGLQLGGDCRGVWHSWGTDRGYPLWLYISQQGFIQVLTGDDLDLVVLFHLAGQGGVLLGHMVPEPLALGEAFVADLAGERKDLVVNLLDVFLHVASVSKSAVTDVALIGPAVLVDQLVYHL